MAISNGPAQLSLEMALVRAADAAKVRQIVKVSAPLVTVDTIVHIADVHRQVEREIETLEIAYAHLRPCAFMQNLLMHAATIHRFRKFFETTGAVPLNMIDCRDVADVAAVLLAEFPTHRRSYYLTGPEAVTFGDVARRLNSLGGRVKYINQSPVEFRQGLERARLPEWLVQHILEVQALVVAQPELPNRNVESITGTMLELWTRS